MWLAWIERRFEAMMRRAGKHLSAGETVLASTWGGCGLKGNRPGVMIATENRVLRYSRFLWREDVTSCSYNAITMLREHKVFWGRRVEIHFINGAIVFFPCEFGHFAEKSSAVINLIMSRMPKSEPAPATDAGQGSDAAERLEKLHGLLTQGAITQTEYDGKKQELLKRL